MTRRRPTLRAVAALAALVATCASAAVAAPLAPRQLPNQGPNEFEVYYLGNKFGELGLTRRIRRLDKRIGTRLRANYWSFLYGTCQVVEDAGCTSPIEVQNWPACERNLTSYKLDPEGDPLPSTRSTIRGVPAFAFEDGERLELYTGKTTVVIFGDDPQLIRQAADQLRLISGKSQKNLPPPVAGALQGTLHCTG